MMTKNKKLIVLFKTKLKSKVKYNKQPTKDTSIIKPTLKLLKYNFFKWDKTTNEIMPTAYYSLVNIDHKDILIFFNKRIKRIIKKYSMYSSSKDIKKIIYGLKHSCALTLTIKYKIRRRVKVFKVFGNSLKCPKTGLNLKIPTNFYNSKRIIFKKVV